MTKFYTNSFWHSCGCFAVIVATLLMGGCAGAPSPLPHTATLMPDSTSGASRPSPTELPLRHATSMTSTLAGVLRTTPASELTVPALRTPEDALAFTINMQETNGGCELPCWWGITPGETTSRAAMQILFPVKNYMEIFPGFFNGRGELDSLLLDSYSNLRVDLSFAGKEQPVNSIAVYSFIPSSAQHTQYHNSWRRYFLYELLTQLGKPSDVWLGFGRYSAEDQRLTRATHFYELYVLYQDLGIISRYMGPAVTGGVNNRACPTLEQVRDLYLFIKDRSAERLIGPPGEQFTDARSLDKISNMSVEQFYQAALNSKQSFCIESPAKLWP